MEKELLKIKRSNKKLKSIIVILIFTMVLILFLLIAVLCPNKNDKAKNNEKNEQTMDNKKEEQMIDDAHKFISLARQEVIKDRVFRDDINQRYKIMHLNSIEFENKLVIDPEGGKYNRETSYVRYNKGISGEQNAGYCVYLEGSKFIIKDINNDDGCLEETALDLNHIYAK